MISLKGHIGLARVLTIFEVGIALVEMLVLISITFQNWTILTSKTYYKSKLLVGGSSSSNFLCVFKEDHL